MLRTLVDFFKSNGIIRTTKIGARFVRNIILDYPQIVGPVLASNCNINCIMCSLHRYCPPKTMDVDLLNNIAQLGSVSFDFGSISEPFVHSHFLEITQHIKSRGSRVSISTNATLMTDEIAKELVKLKIDSIQVSIDSNQPEIFNRIRKGANFSEVIANIRNLQERKKLNNSKIPNISSCFVAMKSNYELLLDTIKLAAELGIKRMAVNNVEPYTEQMVEESLLQHKELYPKIEAIFDSARELSRNLKMNLVVARLKPGVPRCHFLMPVITPEGDVTPCCELTYDRPIYLAVENGQLVNKQVWRRKKVFGNIREKRLPDIYRNGEYRNFRRNVTNNAFPVECDPCLVKYGIICGL